MSRPLRIEYPDAWYHVMNRGRRSEEVFEGKKDYDTFIDILKELVEDYKVNIAAYCLMTNHYHLLIQTPKANISRSMRHLSSDFFRTAVIFLIKYFSRRINNFFYPNRFIFLKI